MIVRPLHGVRAIDELHAPDASIYQQTQAVAARVCETGSWGCCIEESGRRAMSALRSSDLRP